jgi:hypothetical protein
VTNEGCNSIQILYIRYISDIYPIYNLYIELMTDESKNNRFRRLAESRGNRLIREIMLLGNLSNQKNYSYSEDEVERLFAPIQRELDEVRGLFDTRSPSVRKVNLDEN